MASSSDAKATSSGVAAPPPAALVVRKPLQRPGFGKEGQTCTLLTNHFNVTLSKPIDVGQYDVSISYEDDPTDNVLIKKNVNRKVMGKLQKELSVKVVFDGERNLYTLGALPSGVQEYKVSLDRDSRPRPKPPSSAGDDPMKKRRMEGSHFKVRISFATKVDMQCLFKKEQTPRMQDALRVLDVLLREQAARMEYVQLRESYFHHTLGPIGDLKGGVVSWTGYHASFRSCSSGLTLNLNPSTTIVIKPLLVNDFVGEYLNKDLKSIRPEDLVKVKRILKGVEVEVYAGTKHKIFGFSEQPAFSQSFDMKEKLEDGSFATSTITILDYYQKRYKEQLKHPYLHCVNVGKATRPVFIPMEYCRILPGQRYKRKLTGNQVKMHMDGARLKPDERIVVVNKGVSELLKNAEVDLQAFSVKVENKMVNVQARVLPPPSLKFGTNDEVPDSGSWNYNRKTIAKPAEIDNWSVVSFYRGGEPNARQLSMQLKNCCHAKNLKMPDPAHVIAEQPRNNGRSPIDRVNFIFEELKSKLKKPPSFLLCILPQKDSDLYAPFKRKFLIENGVVNQCIVPTKPNDQYFTNVALKINAKCGGYNSVLSKEFSKQLPKISAVPTMILGMDVSHGQTASDSPSLAAIVGSQDWPRITRYAARISTQAPRQEDIANIPDMLVDLIKVFAKSQQKPAPPQQMIIFRDGVSESQFESVLSVELGAVILACESLKIRPKITLVVAQKRHHTRFMPLRGNYNVRPGTVVDRGVTHPTNYDFFLNSHKGMLGTSRPTHYVVLYDEIGFTPDELQNTVNQLCYTYVKSTTAVSVVAPVYYAHLAAQKARNFMCYDASESGSSHRDSQRGEGGGGKPPVPDMPKLHQNVANSMFFV